MSSSSGIISGTSIWAVTSSFSFGVLSGITSGRSIWAVTVTDS